MHSNVIIVVCLWDSMVDVEYEGINRLSTYYIDLAKYK